GAARQGSELIHAQVVPNHEHVVRGNGASRARDAKGVGLAPRILLLEELDAGDKAIAGGRTAQDVPADHAHRFLLRERRSLRPAAERWWARLIVARCLGLVRFARRGGSPPETSR